MSLRHPERIRMSKKVFKSSTYFLKVHSEHCTGKFAVDQNYKGSAMNKAVCPQCGAVGFIIRPTNYGETFEGYLPLSFSEKRIEESHTFRVFACKECGETLDQPVNNSPVLCPVCGTDQFKPSFNFDGDKPTMYKRVKIS